MGVIGYEIRRGNFDPAGLTLLDDAARRVGAANFLERLRRGATPRVFERYLEHAPVGVICTHDAIGDLVPHVAPVADSLGLLIPDGEGNTWILAFDSPRIESLTEGDRRLWVQVALHLGASARLARQPGSLEDPEVEAIMDASGRLVHGSDALTPAAREQLRRAVLRVDRARTRRLRSTPDEALALWGGLLAGRLSLVDHFDTDGRRYIVARRNEPRPPFFDGLAPRERQVAFYCSVGFTTKETAYALGVSASTVRTHLSSALRKLGMRRRIDLVVLSRQLLESAFRAAAGSPARSTAEPAALSLGEPGDLDAICVPDAAPQIPGSLSEAEREIASLLVRGRSHEEIARTRARSPSTIANQIQAIYRKLGVSSALELAAVLRWDT